MGKNITIQKKLFPLNISIAVFEGILKLIPVNPDLSVNCMLPMRLSYKVPHIILLITFTQIKQILLPLFVALYIHCYSPHNSDCFTVPQTVRTALLHYHRQSTQLWLLHCTTDSLHSSAALPQTVHTTLTASLPQSTNSVWLLHCTTVHTILTDCWTVSQTVHTTLTVSLPQTVHTSLTDCCTVPQTVHTAQTAALYHRQSTQFWLLPYHRQSTQLKLLHCTTDSPHNSNCFTVPQTVHTSQTDALHHRQSTQLKLLHCTTDSPYNSDWLLHCTTDSPHNTDCFTTTDSPYKSDWLLHCTTDSPHDLNCCTLLHADSPQMQQGEWLVLYQMLNNNSDSQHNSVSVDKYIPSPNVPFAMAILHTQRMAFSTLLLSSLSC